MKHYLIGLVLFLNLSIFGQESTDYFSLDNSNIFRFFETIENQNIKISSHSKKWLTKFKEINLEEIESYIFDEISGSSSINLKIKKIDILEGKGFKSFGTFVTENEAANPNTEAAYFGLSILLKVDHMVRPSVRYHLGPKATLEFQKLLESTKIVGQIRSNNKKNILERIKKDSILSGCLKAKKNDTSFAFENLVQESRFTKKISLNKNFSLAKFLDASSLRPKNGDKIQILKDFSGDALVLSRELSIMLTLDAVFAQYDRFSGGNVVIEKDKEGNAHFVLTDNGGAYVVNGTKLTEKISRLFSRYDKEVIKELKEFRKFLKGETHHFYGYSDPQMLIFDLGLSTNFKTDTYRKALIANLDVFLNFHHENFEKYGDQIYF